MRLTSRAEVTIAVPPHTWVTEILEKENLGSGSELTGFACFVSSALTDEHALTSTVTEQLEVVVPRQWIFTNEPPRDPPSSFALLDEVGIIRLGSSVKLGDVLVGLKQPAGPARTPEEILLEAIFGPRSAPHVDASVCFPETDPGVVTHVQIFAPQVYRCAQCKLVRPSGQADCSRKTCPRCGGAFTKESGQTARANDKLVRVLIEVTFRRPLRVGDQLVDPSGRKLVVARVLPDEVFPEFRNPRTMIAMPIDILVSPEAMQMAPLLESGLLAFPVRRRKDNAVAGQAMVTVVEKVSALRRDKVTAVSSRARSFSDNLPAEDERAMPQRIGLPLIRGLAAQGLWRTARELLALKADAPSGAEAAYMMLSGLSGPDDPLRQHEPSPMDLWVPDATCALLAFARSCGIRIAGVTATGEEVELPPVDPGSHTIVALRPRLESDAERLTLSAGAITVVNPYESESRRPTAGGLFGLDIFGPTDDYTCGCGKTWGRARWNTRCATCGVLCGREVLRHRTYGHVELPIAVSNPGLYEAAARLSGSALERPADATDRLDRLLDEFEVPAEVRTMKVLSVSPPAFRWYAPRGYPASPVAGVNLLYATILEGMSSESPVRRELAGFPEERFAQYMVQRMCCANVRDASRVIGAADAFVYTARTLFDKRTSYSAGGIVVTDSSLSPREIGLPQPELMELLRPAVLRRLRRDVGSSRSARRWMEEDPSSSEVHAALVEAAAEAQVLVTSERAPGSFIVAEPRIVAGEAFHLNPVNRGRLGLTFGGERVQVHLVVTAEARDELARRALRQEFVGEPTIPHLTPERLFIAAIRKEMIPITPIDALALGCVPAGLPTSF